MNLKQWLVTSVVLAVVTIFLVATVVVAFKVGPQYEYRDAVHGYIDNACSSPTPELMKENLQLARTGMVELDLTPDKYGRLVPWGQTPDWRMDYQYARLDAVVERCDEVIAWRDSQDLTSGQIVDVYKEKMDTLRDLISGGNGVDYIAYRTYMIENHPFLYLYSPLMVVFLAGLVVSAFINFVVLDELAPCSRSRRAERAETRFEKDDLRMLFGLHTIIWMAATLIGLIFVMCW